MADEDPPFRPLSGASLGLTAAHPEPDGDAVAGPFDVIHEHRYVAGGVLGRGGMGEVRSAFDARLQRLVALKYPTRDDPAGARRLIAEAMVTARLVHPGIIAIHDAGRLSDGRPFYTMPIVRGRSLADAMAGATLPSRLGLMRHFLDACEAMAYAHSAGLLHRDLKPANILVGPFGETIIVDWGLAGPAGDRVGSADSPVGTPGYLSPEQARGEPLTPAADVYSLGVTLRQLITAQPPGGDSPPSPDPGIPPELTAIADRATQARAGDRYPDARALADDVAAWFEGRRVAAHRYTPRELIGRAWQSHRVPIVAGLLALIGIAVATVVGYRRTAIEHDRARDAERAAIEARSRSDRHLARAEVAQALEAMGRDEWADAEVLASSALVHGESPEARGVLARFDGRARPALVRRVALPGCTRVAASLRGERVSCTTGDTLRIFAPDAPVPLQSMIELPHLQVAFAGRGDALVIEPVGAGLQLYRPGRAAGLTPLETPAAPRLYASGNDRVAGWIGGNKEQWADLEHGTSTRTRWCRTEAGSIPAVLGISPAGSRVVVCQNGTLLMGDASGSRPVRPILRLDASKVAPVTLAFSVPDGRRAVLGLANGGAVVIDLEEGRVVRTFERDSGALFDVALAGDRLALSDGRDNVYVLDVATGAQVSQLNARRARVSWLDAGRHLRVVGRAIEDWRLPATPPWPHLHPGTAGVASLSISPDSLHAASAHGDGRVRLWRLDRAEPLAEFRLHWSVAKDLEFSPDGRTLAVISAQGSDLYLIDVAEPPRLRSIQAEAGRRLAWLAGDLLLLATYRGGMLAWRRGASEAAPLRIGDVSIYDMETDSDRRAVTLRTSRGRVRRLDASTGQLTEGFGAMTSNGVAGHPDRIALIHESELEVREADGSSRRVQLPGGPATDVALSPDGLRVAVGHIDGTVTVWLTRTMERRAVLRGHVGRVAAVAFDRRGDWLVTGSWDGDLRTWSMGALEETPRALVEQAQSAWGQSIEDVLFSRTGSPY